MIPTNLKLRNFTAYGRNTTELDFTPLKLVVLTGDNGAGKSSILDAITWCIWGWSRAGDNSDRLIRIGESEMEIELSFLLEGKPYLIKRLRKSSGTGSTTLQFFAGLNNLTEGTIRATQEKIIQTLHLTYETFINSSYLRQGHADEFTVKGPTDRKKILTDILGLDIYDDLEERAKLKSNKATNQIALLAIQISELEQELASSPIHQETQSKVEVQLKKIQSQITTAEKALEEQTLLKERVTMNIQTEKVRGERLLEKGRELEEFIKERKGKEDEYRKFDKLTKRRSEIEDNYQKLLDIRTKLRGLEEIQSQILRLKNEAAVLQEKVSGEELAHQTTLQRIASKKDAAQSEITKLQNDLVLTQSDQATCPTCGQRLGKDEHATIVNNLKKKVADQEKMIVTLEEEHKLANNFIPPTFAELKKQQVMIEKMEPQLLVIEKLREEVLNLEEFETQKRELDVAAAQIQEIIVTGKKIKAHIDRLATDIAREAPVDITELEEKLAELVQDVKNKDLNLRSLRQEEGETREHLAEVKQLVARSTQMTVMLINKKEDKLKATETETNYSELAQAFGKRGIQAMIIEAAIPEIEAEANELLGKLTDGRMQIQLVTQRETKTSGISETLDIVISDEMGSRSYEMYSGGEAFRINLAIRLALSRLLTHRAGARLQFLIIDEGFGTQDTQGKDKVVQAINLISNEFEKIFIVTHDTDLKEAFPQRIEVIRKIEGSSFEVFI